MVFNIEKFFLKLKTLLSILFFLTTIFLSPYVFAVDEVTITNRGSFDVESKDKNFKYHIGGRLFVDAVFHNEDKADLVNGTEFRTAEINFAGTLFKDWKFLISEDFASNTVLNTYSYLYYTGFEDTVIKIGSSDETWGLENWTSNRYITFIERASPNSLCLCDFRIGLTYFTGGDNWSIASDIKGEGAGANSSDDEGHGVSGRITFAPFHADRGSIHLGMSGIYRKPGDDVSTTSVSARPESHITSTLVDTGTISNVSDMTAFVIEFAGVFGPFSLQTEYVRQNVFRNNDSGNYHFDGYYAFLSWFLTGDSRNYDATWGGFGRISPRKMFGEGGIGALEAAVRYSSIDLNDDDIKGGKLNTITLGLNWYPNSNIRFMANYILTDTDNNAVTPNDNPSIFLFRTQVEF